MKPRVHLPVLDEAAIADIWSQVEVRGPSECWPWQGYTNFGYGIWYGDGEAWKAHRLIWVIQNGPIPDDLQIDHVHERGCRLKSCCNDAHMEPVAFAENIRRYHRSRMLDPSYDPNKCKRGHDRLKGRPCGKCQSAAVARSMAKQPEKYREMKRLQKQKERARRSTGSVILFSGLDNPDGLRGATPLTFIADPSYYAGTDSY